MKRLEILVFSLVYLLFSWQAAATEAIQLDPAVGSYKVGTYSQIYTDKSREAKFPQVLEAFQKGEFQKETHDLPNYGFTGHAYWFQFSAQTLQGTSDPWYFGVEYPLVDHIHIFYKVNGEWKEETSGDWVPFQHRSLKNRYFYFQVPVTAEGPTEFFVRLQTEGSSEFRMYFKSLHAITSEDHESQYYQGAFVGLMAVMIAYYLLLTIGSRSLEYFCLTAFLASMLLFKMVMNGLAFEYLWPQSVWWGNKASALSVPLIFLTSTLNAYSFLPVDKYPRMQKIYRVVIAILALESCLSFVLPYIAIKAYILTGMVATVLIYSSATYSLIKGYKPARFFLLAWIALIMGSGMYGMQKLGILPISFFTVNGLELASASLVILLSVGFSDKINEMNKAKREAERQARLLTEEMNTKLEAQVAERTAQLWQQTKGMEVMLDNIQQGICTIDGEGTIQKQYSPFLERILGEKKLENQSLFSLLFERSSLSGEEKSMVKSVVDASIQQDALNFETNSHLLPRNLTIPTEQGLRHVEVEWAAIEDKDGSVQRVLTAIRDVTEIKKAEEMAAARAKELEVIGAILEMPASKFKNYISSARQLLHDCYEILEGRELTAQFPVILRNVHTIKGNSRTYDLDDMSQLVHEVENLLFSFNRKQITAENVLEARKGLKRIEEQLRVYEILHDDKLKRGTFADLEGALVRLTSIVADGWAQLPGRMQRELGGIVLQLDALNVNSFAKALKPIIHSLKPLSEQMKKKTPRVELEGADFYLDQAQIAIFEDVFVHLFRNSLDHGFEAEKAGAITIRIFHRADTTEIIYRDDGRGLNLGVLRRKALENGLLVEGASDLEVAMTIFEPGVSSAQQVTEISGRGVGMDAVRAFIEKLHGNVTIELEDASKLPGFRNFSIRFHLPPQKQVLQLDQVA